MNTDRARAAVAAAIRRGELTRLDVCELCGLSASDYNARAGGGRRTSIVAHHWAGYDHPLEVWWVCRSCNTLLQHRHDGSLTRAEARALVAGPLQVTRQRIAAGETTLPAAPLDEPGREGPGVLKPIYVEQFKLWPDGRKEE